MDPEIEAMASVANALSALDDQSRLRVLRWASDKFGVTIHPAPARAQEEKADLEQAGEKGQVEPEQGKYDSFAEFFSAAAPSSEWEKVLVAGYWFQTREGQSDLTSALLNRELKHLGHSIASINHKFSTLMGFKPQLAIQLKKSGSAKQARKKYKITQAGIAKVEEMLRS